jgi:hypothetical protein
VINPLFRIYFIPINMLYGELLSSAISCRAPLSRGNISNATLGLIRWRIISLRMFWGRWRSCILFVTNSWLLPIRVANSVIPPQPRPSLYCLKAISSCLSPFFNLPYINRLDPLWNICSRNRIQVTWNQINNIVSWRSQLLCF